MRVTAANRMIRKTLPDIGVLALLLLLPLLLLAPVALGSKTLLPVDYLFLFEPYRAEAADLGVTYPHNHLVADLIRQNYAWKRFFIEDLHNREIPLRDRIPLWDPYIFAGHPFMANGQHSALYPLSVVFYVLPLWRAYGVFAWLQLGLAGIFAYLFARVLSISRLGGLITGITFQFSGFMVVSSAAHPMIIAGASWLPFIMAMVELVLQQSLLQNRRLAALPWVLLGAMGLGCQMLAGHGEITGFALLVIGVYALWRLGTRPPHKLSDKSRLVAWILGWFVGSRRTVMWLVLLVTLGLMLGAVQFIPMYEVASASFRGGEAAASLEQVLGYAYPKSRLIAFGIPNFFGNPSHHGYFDLFTWHWMPAQTYSDGQYIDWGIKNYVEGGAYLGLLPVFLAAIAVLTNQPTGRQANKGTSKLVGGLTGWFFHPHISFFTLLTVFSLGCIFGTPLYALVYMLPYFNQSHSPFRWVFPLTLAIAVLAGFGVDAVWRNREADGRVRKEARGHGGTRDLESRTQSVVHNTQCSARNTQSRVRDLFLLNTCPSLEAVLAALAFWVGLAILIALVFSRVFFAQVEPVIEWVFQSLAWSREKVSITFPDHRTFYSYEFKWVTLFGLLLTATGIVLRLSRCAAFVCRWPMWKFLIVVVLVVDFVTFGAGFHPAVDPALLDHVPPVIKFLQQDTSLWRYVTFTPFNPDNTLVTTKTMFPNVGMFYGFQSVDGYDSLFTLQYVDYMALIEGQGELQYNQIASFHKQSSLNSPLTDLLNVKYVITEVEIDSPKYPLVYKNNAVRVYENLGAMPRVFTLPISATLEADDFGAAVQTYDPRYYVILDAGVSDLDVQFPQPAISVRQSVSSYASNRVCVKASVFEPSWLMLTDSYFPGWKASVQRDGKEEGQEVEIYRVDGNFRGVLLEPGAWTVCFKYNPDSVKIGAFISSMAGMAVLFLTGLYFFGGLFITQGDRR